MIPRLQAIVVALLLVLAVPLALAQDSQEETATGLVISAAGDVVIDRAGSAERATEGYVLRNSDTVIVPEGARCSGFTPDGERFDLVGPGELVLATASGEGVVGSVTSWVKRQLNAWIGESRRRPLTTRGGRDWAIEADAPAPILPAPEGAVRSGTSRLCWSTVAGADSYSVVVAPEVGDEIAKTARDNCVVLEGLEPGKEYVWKVSADIAGWNGDSGWRAFRVLTPEDEKELDAGLADLSDLEAGVLLLSAGLHEEAVYRFDAAIGSSDFSRSARMWRARALADLGLYREAYEDLSSTRGQE